MAAEQPRRRRRARKMDMGGSGVSVPTPRGTVKLFGGDRERDDAISGYVEAMKQYASNQFEDPFHSVYGGNQTGHVPLPILQPAFDINALMRLPNQNNILKQCIQAMVVNIESFGHQLEYVGPDEERDSDAAQKELSRIENLLDAPNGEYSVVELRERLRADLEGIGFAFIEVGRDNTGQITMLHHVPANTMRKTRVEAEPVAVPRIVTRNGQEETIHVRHHFRRFVQVVSGQSIYFKEFGDPRPISPKDGREAEELAIEDQATEVIYLDLYTPGHAYGLPRWINQLPAVLGSRESELTNLSFFRDNAIPAMAVMVAGGSLTAESVSRLEENITAVTGRESVNRVMVIEAMGDEESADDAGRVPVPQVKLETLSGNRQNDELFQDYDKNNANKIRSSFRLPPIFLGNSDDYTRATAEAAITVAEAQVFGPERKKLDNIFNQRILVDEEGRQPQYWRYKSLPPKVVSPDAVIEAVTTFNEVGALTPNVAINLANSVFDMQIEPVEEAWGNFPFRVIEALMGQGVVMEGIGDLLKNADRLTTAAPPPTGAPADNADDDEGEEAEKSVTIRARGEVLKMLESIKDRLSEAQDEAA